MQTIRKIPIGWKIVIVLDIIGVAFFIWLFYIYPRQDVSAQAMPAFSHENCQYPERATNPPDGCDNSDPACPELIKGATSCPADNPTPAPVAEPQVEPAAKQSGGRHHGCTE